ncbi:MAG: hypothetical protein H7343_12660 [Undibacterium sp.]|nr:hypothetical protein [Opitutaceae bacterium]
MNALFLKTGCLAVSLATAAFAADATPTPEPASPPAKPVTEEMIRARLAEHIKIKAATKQTSTAPSATATLPPPAPAAPAATATTASTPPATAAEKEAATLAQSKTEPPAMLPKVEVRRGRATEIEREVFQQEKDIAREKLKTKSTDADRALNAGGKSKVLSIFGGETTKQRETVASERVSLMESERDIMEAIAYAKTKEQKDALRKELNEIKALRRDLETSLR